MIVRIPLRPALPLLLAIVAGSAVAATSATLPAWVCAQPDTIFASAFDTRAQPVPHDPSFGSGGAYPGSQTRTLHIAGLGSGAQDYYIYLPSAYDPSRPWPLLLAFQLGTRVAGILSIRNLRDFSGWCLFTIAHCGGRSFQKPIVHMH